MCHTRSVWCSMRNRVAILSGKCDACRGRHAALSNYFQCQWYVLYRSV